MATTEKTKKAAKPKRPKILYANASPLSIGGASMFEAEDSINAENVVNFFSEEQIINDAVNKLQLAGFDILQVSQATINIAGSIELFEKSFATKIVSEEREVIKPGAQDDTATFWECPSTDIPGLITAKGTPFDNVLEGVAVEEPRYLMSPSMYPPTKEYWHLRIPGDVSLGCNADKAHRAAITGKGVKVAMVDSGWYRHPYFTGRGYRVSPVVLGPGASNPNNDESGHGTGESANIFAVAPDAQLLPVKMSFVNSAGAFNTAVGLNPDIITCSWGSSIRIGPLSAANQTLAAAIATAVGSGIVVIFAAGNGHFGFPGQHLDVISAGGVFMDSDGSLRASNYSSGFMSEIYPNRRVPDLSGLVGMSPGASYIMLPLEPGDKIDRDNAGGTHPPGDETAPDDGWAAFSGTSAAAPQLAGAAALVKQACGRLSPHQVRDVLMKTAKDVTAGNCRSSTGGHAATRGPDLATGNGLVDAHKATLVAKVRCLHVIRPPAPPVRPPVRPVTPIRPPVRPVRPPVRPEPIKRPEPIRRPIEPIRPRGLSPEEEAALQTELYYEEATLSSEDIEALEDMILSSGIDPEDLDK
ncbi:MAG: S8 family serine peptidase [Desulfobulbaceae bacterium]|nr:S8 family serine peptidase [Desulfobulbaceae bacterium]